MREVRNRVNVLPNNLVLLQNNDNFSSPVQHRNDIYQEISRKTKKETACMGTPFSNMLSEDCSAEKRKPITLFENLVHEKEA